MTTSTSDSIETLIRAEALRLGFDACRFADASEAWPASDRLAQFVDAGRHGEMAWMAQTAERRAHPTAMWGEARSAVMLGVNYGPDADPREILAHPELGAISAYAQGDDYHELIKKRLKTLARWMQQRFPAEVKVFVDTAPLMEKPLAERAGLGWQGRHTNLVSREFGSWLFLGAVLTTRELKPDAPSEDHCGACHACLDACPTNAFPAPYQLDARRCISYLTIELQDAIPAEFRPALGNRIYGCDDCLAACPWNKFAQIAHEQALHAREALRAPPLGELALLDEAAFRALFAKSPVKRIGRDRFVRNVLYAIGNSGDVGLVTRVLALLDDPAPVVRGAAAWALRRLAPEVFAGMQADRASTERDWNVQAEWSPTPAHPDESRDPS
ncbi:tRNA epoxyqueuosine(34) reductase QueG [Phenylobacterium sp.]|uniref:tRNA epoxyqueuosine(34) reductase QueG n=1 Tax=Phenylobacterium sp. TaxID=1871053 RepID=UPI0027363613|nr:tRNA epoxyqueuosine(34) reductase QueG [Phenylobacterium sp.]MDP3661143.1 tRNA epoxyqueuosine(34) reductase QueG [Phenylobacterium sp.]